METVKNDLREIFPVEIEVKLESVDVPLKVRSCTLADDIWAEQKFGKSMEEVLTAPKLAELVQIFYRLLEKESQELFLLREVKFIDDNGVSISQKIGGAELLVWSIKGGRELLLVSKAIMQSIGFSRPILDAAEVEMLKKKSIPTINNENKQNPGKQSSTSSPTNMDGQQTTFLVEPSEKLLGESRLLAGVTEGG